MGENKNIDSVVKMNDNREDVSLLETEKQPVLKHLQTYKHLSQNLLKEDA